MNVTMELTIAALTVIASIQMIVLCVFVTLDGVETVLYVKLKIVLVCGFALWSLNCLYIGT